MFLCISASVSIFFVFLFPEGDRLLLVQVVRRVDPVLLSPVGQVGHKFPVRALSSKKNDYIIKTQINALSYKALEYERRRCKILTSAVKALLYIFSLTYFKLGRSEPWQTHMPTCNSTLS